MEGELEILDWLVILYFHFVYHRDIILLMFLKYRVVNVTISFIQSAGDSSMSSGSLGDRRSDSPDLRSLSPGGNY